MQTEDVILSLERLRGAVSGMAHFRGCSIFAVIRPCLPCLLTLLQLYIHHVLITALLFKLAAALVDDVLPGLESADGQVCVQYAAAPFPFSTVPSRPLLLCSCI
jgi:hypothetical protein